MVTWANSSRGSRLDYQCTLFLSEMMAYMQGSIETYELSIPVPDDKGLLFTTMKLKPQNVKVISEDTIYHC